MSTSGGVQYIRGYGSTSRDVQYIGGCHEYIGGMS